MIKQPKKKKKNTCGNLNNGCLTLIKRQQLVLCIMHFTGPVFDGVEGWCRVVVVGGLFILLH